MSDRDGPDDRATNVRGGAVEGPDEFATARDESAGARDRRADDRDAEADARDTAADARDRAAEAGDDLSAAEPGAGEPETDTELASAPSRVAAISRRAAARQAAASRDRKEAEGDRAEAAGDRHAASNDRGASARDRAAAGLDELTGAHRRGPGFVQLDREMARAQRTGQSLVLAFVDVNGLKAINDSRGHTTGDRVLREVVETLRRQLRSYDLIIRFGGDEFLCAIPGVSMDEAAERLGAANATLAASPEQGSVTVGLADLRADDTLQDLIARADSALYRSRQTQTVIDLTGPNRAQFPSPRRP